MGIDNVVRRGHVDIIDSMTFLVIPDSNRNDSGKYCLTVSSPAGEKAVFVQVKVLGMMWHVCFSCLHNKSYANIYWKKCLSSNIQIYFL